MTRLPFLGYSWSLSMVATLTLLGRSAALLRPASRASAVASARALPASRCPPPALPAGNQNQHQHQHHHTLNHPPRRPSLLRLYSSATPSSAPAGAGGGEVDEAEAARIKAERERRKEEKAAAKAAKAAEKVSGNGGARQARNPDITTTT